MNSFEFVVRTKLCAGEKVLEHIPYELSRFKAVKPLIVTDPVIEKLGLLKTLTTAMTGMDVSAVYTDVPADGDLKKVESAAAFYREKGCDAIVALGGGSVIDTAKGVVLLISQGKEKTADILGCEELSKGTDVPFVAVPTTAGTGSEATTVAVIADVENKIKLEIITDKMLPHVAVLDPRMTVGLPARVTAATAADALCHAIEAYSCRQKNPVSDAFAYGAIKMILDALPKVLNDPKNEKARLSLAVASFMAGVSFSNSMVGAVHAIGHSLGALCHIPHGEAMAILLPHVMRFNACPAYAELSDLFHDPNAVMAVEILMDALHKKTDMPIRLSETGKVAEADLDAVAEKALNDGAMLFNPKTMTKQDVLSVLKEAF